MKNFKSHREGAESSGKVDKATSRQVERHRQAAVRILRMLTTQRIECLLCVLCASAVIWLCTVMARAQTQSVINSPHNLSAAGPGVVRAMTEEQVCIFCHTPHNASPIRPLWNRLMPLNAYTPYTSSALDARPGQPTGSSKMCLSCHDGTIALGSVISRDQIIQMSAGITTLPPGSSNLGTDLSDDHPISFKYDSALFMKDPKLVDPHQLPSHLRLDHNQELQCTTCHDPHNDVHGDFLAMSNFNSTLCTSCHRISTTTIPTHRDCNSCHKTHTAPSGPYLLKRDTVTNSCLSCHDGSWPGAWNVMPDFNKISVHDTRSPIDPPDHIPFHSTCADCHEPHTMMSGISAGGGLSPSLAPRIQPTLGRISGVNASGAPMTVAQNEYEVCFKCHADQNVFNASWISRQITQTNTRLEFDPSAISYHPVEAPGKNPLVPSLKPGWTVGSIVYCSDCHNSDTGSKAMGLIGGGAGGGGAGGGSGGAGPNGVHGSNERPLLIARYATADFTTESATNYALCYRCHERDLPGKGILDDVSFPFHRKHIVDARTPCSACHDAHGISSAQGTRANNSHLINFDTTIVFPHRTTGVLRFVDAGIYRGSCTLTCHSVDHLEWEY